SENPADLNDLRGFSILGVSNGT
ncbi:MAG: hypothetical protein RI974_582, partial [Actinomycetota bacterium]